MKSSSRSANETSHGRRRPTNICCNQGTCVVDTSHVPWLQQMFVGRLLPWLVSFADREELFMTALGAGTTLTLLNALGSPTLVLHGHKHYPTARLLRATQAGDGDVLVASAGSAGVLEHYHALGPIERTFLWASFNA